jgi:hypothetical protein
MPRRHFRLFHLLRRLFVRSFMVPSLLIFLSLLSPMPAVAGIIHVPSDYSKIQLAINAAANGDTVLVADGHYYERLAVRHKAVFIASGYVSDRQLSHVENTIIDGDPSVLGASDSGSVARFIMTDAGPCGLIGLTLQNGTGTLFNLPNGSTGNGGGGVFCFFGYPTLERVTIRNCSGQHGSGLLSVTGSSVEVRFSTIQGQVSCIDAAFAYVRDSSHVGPLEVLGASGSIESASSADSIYCRSYGILNLANATVTGNVWCLDSSMTTFANSTIGGRSTFRIGTRGQLSRCRVNGVTVDSCLQPEGEVALDSCLVTGPSKQSEADLRFSHCTLLAGVEVSDAVLVLDSSVVSLSGGSVVSCVEGVMAVVQGYCNDFYGYSGASWFDCPNIFLATDNIINANPYFCDAARGDYRIADSSACAPANNTCKAQLGAYSVGCGCCQGTAGNVNMTGIVDSADLAALVSYLTGGGYVPTCRAEANINGTGIVDSADLSSLVSYLTGAGFVFPKCY